MERNIIIPLSGQLCKRQTHEELTAPNTSGERNVFIGHQAGYNNISGKRNVIIGTFAGITADTDSNTFAPLYIMELK